jgi:hypothetical protein
VSLLANVVLMFSGSLDGATATGQTVRLLAPNATIPMQATVTYDDASHTATGTKVVGRHVATLTADGRLAKNTLMTAGPDAILGTADDVPSGYVTYDVGPPGTQTRFYSTAGADGVWFTADDVVGTFGKIVFDSLGREASAVYDAASGPDAVPFTADDLSPIGSPTPGRLLRTSESST